MRYYRIPRFSGIEAHRTDVDRGVLRICEGAIPAPVGSIRSGPVWTALGGSDVPSMSAGQLKCMVDGTSFHGYQFVSATISGGVVVTGVHINTNQTDVPPRLSGIGTDPGELHNISIGGTVPYISDIGSNTVFVGTGSGTKKVTYTYDGGSTEHSSDNLSASTGYYQMENDVFPNCTTFVIGMNKAVFAAGDPANPLRVYVSEPATGEDPLKEGIYSKDHLSKIDILCTNASKITALSTYQNYIVVHTDAGVVLLY